MFKYFKIALLTALILPLASQTSQGGIVKVAKRYNLIDLSGGWSSPVGKYDGLAGFVDIIDQDDLLVEVDGDVIYDPTYHVAVSYGQLRNNRMLITGGFRYTDIKQVPEYALVFTSIDGVSREASLRQYDLDLNLNYMFFPITEQSISPYVGVGFRAGFTTARAQGFESESHLNTVLAGNIGAEVKLWEAAQKRSFVTLALVNSYDLFSSGDRPKYLNIGGGLKYYFRP